MEAPQVLDDLTQSRKSCWTCETLIPYSSGWCGACWHALGDSRQGLVGLATGLSDKVLSGRIYMAVCDSLREERRPKPVLVPRKKKISLDDLEIVL